MKFRYLNFRDLQTKIHIVQKNIANFIKERRTIKLLHLLRNYSAVVVVASSAILVVSTNLAAEGKSGGFLFGEFSRQEEDNPREKKISNQVNQKRDLVTVPLARASMAVDPEIKEEKEEIMTTVGQGQVMVASSNSTLKDPEENGGVKIYEVRSGDTVSSIAEKNGITTNTILWANDIDDVDSIMPGDKIFILPIAGLTHIVKDGETLDKIADEYKAEKDKIISFNDLPANGEIEKGQEIVIPGGEKEIPVQQEETTTNRRQYATPTGGAPKTSGWKKLDGKAGTGHSFPYGYCTWYVAQKRFVPWGGNAGTWLYNAKARGYKTGKQPKKGAIIVTSESWWGHVGIVEKVKGNNVTISEMNYRGWAKVSSRTISTKNRVIKGYIY